MPKDKFKLPKRVAGVKIPKQVRKGGKALLEQANTPEGRAALARGAATLVGAIATAAEAKARRRQSAEGVAATPSATPKPANDGVADAIGAGVEAVLGRLFPRK